MHYGPGLSGSFDFRLDLALAHFRGDVDTLVSQLKEELAEIDGQRPSDPSPLAGGDQSAALSRSNLRHRLHRSKWCPLAGTWTRGSWPTSAGGTVQRGPGMSTKKMRKWPQA